MQYNEAQVHVVSVDYQMEPDNTCYILHGTYEIKVSMASGENELFISTYNCPKGAPSPCTDNEVVYKEAIDCERFHNDKTGPWYMFAPAIDQSDKCVEKKVRFSSNECHSDIKIPCNNTQGIFDFNGAILKGEYLENYMALGEGRYRVKMLFHKLGEDMEIEHLRGCIELDFDILA
jgi:hypothetical protein